MIISTSTENQILTNVAAEDSLRIDDGLPLGLRVFECVLVAAGILFAWVGNSAACYAVRQTRRHDPVLGTFILNLLINDFLISAFNMPLSFLTLASGRWPLGEAMCQITACLNRFLEVALPWSICCVAIDKYCAVVYAMHYIRLLTPFRSYFLLAVIWIVACIQAVLPLVGFGEYRFLPATFQCGIAWDANYYYSSLSCIVGMIFPLIITVYCYACVLRTSISHGKRVDAPVQLSRISGAAPSGSGLTRIGSSRNTSGQFLGRTPCPAARFARSARSIPYKKAYNPKKAIKHVLGICGVFLCCWVPYVIINTALMIKHAVDTDFFYDEKCWFVSMALFLIYVNIAINPIVYIIFNHRMKRALKKLSRRLCRTDRIHRRSTVFITNYSSSTHRAAMTRHRARYRGAGLPVTDCKILVSEDSSSSNLLQELQRQTRQTNEQQRSQQNYLSRWQATRGSSALSNFSSATFPEPDCIHGAYSSEDDFVFDARRSTLTPDISGDKKRVQDGQLVSINKPAIRNLAQPRTVRSDNWVNFADNDAVFHNEENGISDNSCSYQQQISIPVARSLPLERKALKKQRCVLFSDSVLTSPDQRDLKETRETCENRIKLYPLEYHGMASDRSKRYSNETQNINQPSQKVKRQVSTSFQSFPTPNDSSSEKDSSDTEVFHPISRGSNLQRRSRKKKNMVAKEAAKKRRNDNLSRFQIKHKYPSPTYNVSIDWSRIKLRSKRPRRIGQSPTFKNNTDGESSGEAEGPPFFRHGEDYKKDRQNRWLANEDGENFIDESLIGSKSSNKKSLNRSTSLQDVYTRNLRLGLRPINAKRIKCKSRPHLNRAKNRLLDARCSSCSDDDLDKSRENNSVIRNRPQAILLSKKAGRVSEPSRASYHRVPRRSSLHMYASAEEPCAESSTFKMFLNGNV